MNLFQLPISPLFSAMLTLSETYLNVLIKVFHFTIKKHLILTFIQPIQSVM